jgi:cytochrome c oxidase subunit 2
VARDVNHGLGLFDPSGRLLTQVQAMPGYSNRLIHVFETPGAYTVRCLEYCGIAHHAMMTTLSVK